MQGGAEARHGAAAFGGDANTPHLQEIGAVKVVFLSAAARTVSSFLGLTMKPP
jgi:hypothetical protein